MILQKIAIFADGRKQIELWQENIIYGHFSKHQHVPQLKEEKNEKYSILIANCIFLCLNEFARSC